MPDLATSIEFIADLEIYQTEKPYYVLVAAESKIDVASTKTTNLEFESHKVNVKDISSISHNYTLENAGFLVKKHTTSCMPIESRDAVRAYEIETQDFLRDHFKASHVVTYETRVSREPFYCFTRSKTILTLLQMRKNVPLKRMTVDIADPLCLEGPATGAHTDVTYTSGPWLISNRLSGEERSKYLVPGYRFRIVKKECTSR